jgi:GT2 family glycosyltransferase
VSARYDIVVPTIGRESLDTLLSSLEECGATPGTVVIADDRPQATDRLAAATRESSLRIDVVSSGGNGPAAARNAGLRRTSAPWVVFLDDDVVVGEAWHDDLVRDLEAANANPDERIGAVQAAIRVPLPQHRRPTDWERNVARLADASWITADLAVRREVLEQVGEFDESFRRAYREDSDFALRMIAAGWRLVNGQRVTIHPVRHSTFWTSVHAQRGNADDQLLLAKHGANFRDMLAEPPSILPQHVVTTIALAVAFIPRRWRVVRRAAIALWSIATLRFTWLRLRSGPWTPDEVVRMTATSIVIPPTATWWSLYGRRLVRANDRAGVDS